MLDCIGFTGEGSFFAIKDIYIKKDICLHYMSKNTKVRGKIKVVNR